MTGIIAGVVADRDQRVLIVDDAIEKKLHDSDSEIDCRGGPPLPLLAVCRSFEFDNWIVHFEQGQLRFRRRQHASADLSFRLAASRCPPRARFAVLKARWVNLTWLCNSRGGHASLVPEALEAGHAAILAAGSDDRAAAGQIQVWLATETKEIDVINPGDLEATDPYTQGLAHEFVGDKISAIRCWLRALTELRTSCAIHKLIDSRIRVTTQSVDCVVDLALGENRTMTSSRCGSLVLLLQRRARELAWGHLDQRIRTIASPRLEELSRYEFQHLIRAFEFFGARETGRQWRSGATSWNSIGSLAVEV